jgi:hypothetical protein
MSGKTLRYESLSTALFSNTRTKERQKKSVDAARAPTNSSFVIVSRRIATDGAG